MVLKMLNPCEINIFVVPSYIFDLAGLACSQDWEFMQNLQNIPELSVKLNLVYQVNTFNVFFLKYFE